VLDRGREPDRSPATERLADCCYAPPAVRQALVPIAIAAVLLAGGAVALFAWLDAKEETALAEARFERQARAAHAREASERRWTDLRGASERYVPSMLRGVHLGMSTAELRRARPAATPPTRALSGESRLEETLSNGAQVVYVFDASGDRLARLQVLSQIPVEGVPPHLQAMRDRYGDASAVLRCSERSAAGVPTLRFVWADERVALQDIFLVHPNGVSVTLYVSAADTLRDSLAAGGCAPVRSREELNDLAIATPEMLSPRVVSP
jgi:hypothetical protein